MTALRSDEVESPIGTILLVATPQALCAVEFADCQDRWRPMFTRRFGVADFPRSKDPGGFSRRLKAYLDGDLAAIDDIPVESGGTRFQQEVWQALRRIPAGETRSYAQMADALGKPGALRAVGAANGRNPLSIVIPCHRLIGSDGKLTGYGGGLHRKRWLLVHEGIALD